MSAKPLSLSLLLLLLATLTGTARAVDAGRNYFGLQYAQATYSEDGFPDFEPTVLVGRFGFFFADNVAFEIRAGFGMDEDTQRFSDPFIGTFDLDLEVDSLLGAYLLAHLPLGANSSIYGLVGLTQGELTATASTSFGSGSISDDDNDVSLGVGFAFGISPNAALNLEYVSYMSKSTFDLNALSFGVNIGF